MKKTIKLFGVVLAAAAMFAACVQDSEVKPAEKATTLSIEPTTIEAEIAPNGPFDVQVKANGTWVVVNSLDWVTVEPNKGEGDATVQVTVAANEKDGEQLAPRSGEISFIGAATCSQTLAIAQAGNEDLLIESVPYTINFCETQGTWTIEDKTLPEALTYVWAQTEKYGMKASAYLNQCYATESWLISPVFDLTKETVAILNIEHALNKGSNAKCAVMAKTTDSAEWVKLDVPTWPGTANEDGSYTGSSWDFVESGDIDLTAFCGKKAQIAFVYGSTDADAPTWEIKTVVVTNDASPKFSVPTEDINIRAFDTEATIKVSGNVDWTAVASEGAVVEPAEGKGGLTVTVTVPENTDMENVKEYTVTFKTTAAVETAEYVVKIIQAKAEELPATTLSEIFEKGVGVYATGELTVMAKAAGNVIVSDGTANMMYYKSGNELVPGQVIKFANADVQERNGLLQINGSEFELLEKTVTPEYGTAVEIATDEDVQNWGGEPQYQYIHFTGVMGDDNRTIKVGEWGIYIVKTEGYAGKTVSVYGYANGKATSYQTITTTLVSIEAIGGEEPGPEPTPEAATLAEIFEKGAGTYATGELTVMAKAAGNVIVSDGTANMMYYLKDNELVPGQVIKFAKAVVSERNGLLQIADSEYELLDKTVTPEHGTAVEIATDEDVQNWGGVPQYQYIHFTGVMGDDNRTIKVGEWGIFIVKTEGYAGKKVSVYGYANGKATSYQTITTTLVSIEEVAGEEPEPEPVPEATTLAQIFEKGVGTYATGELTVMAKAAGNVIVSDGTANMMYYKSGNELVPGQVIKFANADVQERNGLLQINGSEFELLEKTVTPEYGTAVEIATDEDVQNWGGEPQYQYIHFTGVMADDNRTVKVNEWGIYIIATEGYAGKKVSVYGYANGTAGAKYQTITTTLVSIEEVAGEEPEPEPVVALKNCGEINAAILAGETALNIKLDAPAEITLMGADKKSIFVQDETGAVLIYSADLYTMLSGAGAVAGYAIQGEFTATATVYNGLPEITAAEVGASNLTATNKFPCLNLTIAELLADFDKYLNCKVKISDVTVTDGWSGSDKNGEIEQAGTTIPLYVKNYSNSITVSVPTGAKGNFVGFVAYNKTTKQLTFWEDSGFVATEIAGAITVKSTVSLEVGATAELAATVNSGAALSYASADETVATVSAEGVVTAVKEGTTTITVTAPATGIYTAASAEVAVTVKAASAGGDDPVGTVLYEDKFDWLSDFITAYNADKANPISDFVYGDYADAKARKDYSDSNSPNLNSNAAYIADWPSFLAEQGYAHLHASTYCQYAQGTPENPYMKFCKSKTQDGLSFKPFKAAHESVTISVDWAVHNNGTVLDESHLQIVIEGDGEFENGTKSSEPATSEQTTLDDHNFTHSSFVIKNVTADTVVKICVKEGFDNDFKMSGQHRFYLDNILIVK